MTNDRGATQGNDDASTGATSANTRTYRERRIDRAERLRGWADRRDARSSAAFEDASTLAAGIPLGQPILVGHHSERHARRDRDRINSGMRAGIDHAAKAASMSARADAIEAATTQAIYSDDHDALERLSAKIADLEARRARIKNFNLAVSQAGKVTAEALTLLDDRQRADLNSLARYAPYQLGVRGQFPVYATRNLSGQISKARERVAALASRAPAGVLEEEG